MATVSPPILRLPLLGACVVSVACEPPPAGSTAGQDESLGLTVKSKSSV